MVAWYKCNKFSHTSTEVEPSQVNQMPSFPVSKNDGKNRVIIIVKVYLPRPGAPFGLPSTNNAQLTRRPLPRLTCVPS